MTSAYFFSATRRHAAFPFLDDRAAFPFLDDRAAFPFLDDRAATAAPLRPRDERWLNGTFSLPPRGI
ncbi:MAG: hypothetical protein AAFQ42_09330 [Pseudomonadota bacterium]